MSEPKFETIRVFARRGIVSESYLRGLQKRGQLPGIYVGNRYMINVEQFLKQLDEMSKVDAAAEVSA